ncbi:MAG: LD-carboxypeptidase [Nanoarchaeota archaeon]|nr:LD-carboxypeptidase [Nanoarchaeota archaeon]
MPLKIIKPLKLSAGDTVSLISPSGGYAHKFMDRYLQGKKQIEKTFNLKVINTPNALKSDNWVYNHPEERLNDLMWAFQNSKIKAIITTIGGEDSIRLLRYIKPKHLKIIKQNPKSFIGFSDTTVINFLCLKAGLVSFYGPTVLFGFAENCGIHDYLSLYFKKALFYQEPIGKIENCRDGWTLDIMPWTKEGNSIKRKLQEPYEIKFIQGKGNVKGHLIGGCMETMEILKETDVWPTKKIWKGAILFLETSELMPSVDLFTYWLRNYGAQGILGAIKGIIFGIPGGSFEFNDPGYNEKVRKHMAKFSEYDAALVKVAKEYDRRDLIIATHLNFGHTCPMITLPYGIKMRLDADKKAIRIEESAVK